MGLWGESWNRGEVWKGKGGGKDWGSRLVGRDRAGRVRQLESGRGEGRGREPEEGLKRVEEWGEGKSQFSTALLLEEEE